jgi:hypothetical protein
VEGLDDVEAKLLLLREANLLRHGLLLRGTFGSCRWRSPSSEVLIAWMPNGVNKKKNSMDRVKTGLALPLL